MASFVIAVSECAAHSSLVEVKDSLPLDRFAFVRRTLPGCRPASARACVGSSAPSNQDFDPWADDADADPGM